jgi:hypothetical protein
VQGQSRQQEIDLKLLLKKCFIAECNLADFLLDKATNIGLSIEDILKMKDLTNRVYCLIREINASDEKYHDNPSDDNVPLPYAR